MIAPRSRLSRVMLAGIGAACRLRPAAPESKCRDLPAHRQYC